MLARRLDVIHCDSVATAFDTKVPFYCCDAGNSVMVELMVQDDSGNTSFSMSEAFIYDNSNPGILCPVDLTIECTEDFMDFSLTGNAIATDNCEGFIVSFADSVLLNNCGEGLVMREWIVEDAVGQLSSCTQNIYIENPTTFYINPTDPNDPNDDIIWPQNYIVNSCSGGFDPDSLPLIYSYPQITTDTCEFIGITHEDTYIYMTPDACFKILRKWIVIDWCQFDPLTFEGKWEYGQIIKVFNSDAPQFIGNCQDQLLCSFDPDCENGNITLEAAAMDDCTPEADLVFNYEIDLFNDGGLDLAAGGNSVTGDFPLGTHKVTFYVEDGCDNTTSCNYTFTIIDCEPPTPVCISSLTVDLNSGSVDLYASAFNSDSHDNCSDDAALRYSFSSNTADTVATFTCDEVGFNVLEMWVADENGFQSFCTVFLSVQDNLNVCSPLTSASVSGLIENEDGEEIELVDVSIGADSINPITTGSTGIFLFNDLIVGQTYFLEPTKMINPKNGVTTFDLVLISKHILGTVLLDSPYKIIAADANESGHITTFDIVLLRRLILGVDDDFGDGESWTFIEKTFTFPDPTDPFSANYPENVMIDPLNTNIAYDFIGIKKGDVNGSAAPNSVVGTDPRSKNGNLLLKIENQKLIPGESLQVDFTAEDFQEIQGFQFSLSFDNSKLSFEELLFASIPQLDQNNFSLLLEKGLINVSWNPFEALSLTSDDIVFSIKFKPISRGFLNEALALQSNPIPAEAYARDQLLNVQFQIGESGKPSFNLYQNIPNPFTSKTTIGFDLPEFGPVILTIFTINGKVVKKINQTFSKGYHEMVFDKKDFAGKGIFYYQIQTNFGTSTKRMVLIE